MTNQGAITGPSIRGSGHDVYDGGTDKRQPLTPTETAGAFMEHGKLTSTRE